MADPYIFIDGTGVIVPDTSDINDEVIAEYREVLGQDLVVTADTVQGALISSEVTARVSVAQNNAKLANQINPNEAGGVFLDAICALLGLEREAATRTIVPGVTIGGYPQTLVPAGSQARATSGAIFRTMNSAILDINGVAVVDFESIDYGPIAAPVGALSQVVDMVLGWETVNNTLPGSLGAYAQSDASLRSLRTRTLALRGISISEAITSELYALPGVKSLSYRENVLSTAQTIDGINMVPHSLYVCIDGGATEDIAQVLLANKTVGGNWNGTTTVATRDPASGQTYSVKFSRPTLVPIYARVTVRRGLDLSDPTFSVPQAIVDYANGLIPDEEGLVIGHDASPFEFAAAVNYYHPAMTVTKLELSTDNINFTPVNISIPIDRKAVTQLSFIQVFVV